MKWKEQLRDPLRDLFTISTYDTDKALQLTYELISTEIIEKLVEEARESVRKCQSPEGSDAPLTALKAARLIERIDGLDAMDNLSDKWL
jgi:hypothetical protein